MISIGQESAPLARLELVKRRTIWFGLSVAAAAAAVEILRRRMKESVRESLPDPQ